MPAQVTFTLGKLHAPSMDTATCEEKFKNVLAVEPTPPEAKQIHNILANIAMREGRYRRCLHEIDALLAEHISDPVGPEFMAPPLRQS